MLIEKNNFISEEHALANLMNKYFTNITKQLNLNNFFSYRVYNISLVTTMTILALKKLGLPTVLSRKDLSLFTSLLMKLGMKF